MRALSDATAGMLKPLTGLSKRDRIFIDVDKDLRNFIVRVGTDDEGGVVRSWPSTTATRAWIGRIPERKELKDKTNTWLMAATDYTAEIIKACWPPNQIQWMDPKAETLFDYLLMSTTQQDLNAEAYARFKEFKEVPEGPLEFSTACPLAPYQQAAAKLALRSEGYGFFKEQGTGKTPTSIAVICTEAASRNWQQPYRGLIVAPNNVRKNWVHEFEKFATQPGKVEVIKGGPIDRMSSIIETITPEPDCKYGICIISWDSMVRSLDVLTNIEWDIVILDESHFIKWPETKRAKASFKLRDVAKRRMALTGTPVCNTPLDLYSQFEFMQEGGSGFKSWKSFREFYGVFKEMGGDSHQKLVGVQNLPFMKERLARMSFIIRKAEALPDLPDKLYDTDEVEMTEEQAEAYRKVADELLLKIENELDNSENKAMTVNNVLTQLLRLAQIACGYVTWDPTYDLQSLEEVTPKSIEWFKEDRKLDRLVEILKEKKPEEKTIVWSCFVPCIRKIYDRLIAEGIDCVTFYGSTKDEERDEATRRFNEDPKCKVMISNPAAGGVGVNWPGSIPAYWGTPNDTNTDCDHEIYYAQDWSYVKRAQSEDRCHGKNRCRKPVRITDLVVPDTIDEEIRVRVLKKKMVALEIADIREILQTVIHGMKVKND